MKRTKNYTWGILGLLIGSSIAFSCSKDDSTINAPKKIEMDYHSPAIANKTIVTYLGQTTTIDMTAENVDYIKVAKAPKKWTVTAVIDRLRIRIPDDNEPELEYSGTIDLWLHNRTTKDSTLVSFAANVDFSVLNYELLFSNINTATQTFKWGETKKFAFKSKFLKDVDVSNNTAGWNVSIANNELTVTAPTYSSNVIAIPSIKLQGIKIGDQSIYETPLNAALEIYTVDISAIGSPKTFSVLNSSNQPIGLVCKETAKGTFDDVITTFYQLTNKSYQTGFVFEDGGTLGFDGGYNAGNSTPSTKLNISYDGKIISNSQEALPTTLSPFTTTDHEGNIYHVVKAKGMFWMDQNLFVKTKPTGEAIAFTAPGGTGSTPETHGYLYTTPVATNAETTVPYVRGICPSGWHVPTVSEFTVLYNTPSLLFNSLYTNFGGVLLPGQTAPNMSIGAVMNRIGGGVTVTTLGGNKAIASNAYSTYAKNLRCVKDSAPYIQ